MNTDFKGSEVSNVNTSDSVFSLWTISTPDFSFSLCDDGDYRVTWLTDNINRTRFYSSKEIYKAFASAGLGGLPTKVYTMINGGLVNEAIFMVRAVLNSMNMLILEEKGEGCDSDIEGCCSVPLPDNPKDVVGIKIEDSTVGPEIPESLACYLYLLNAKSSSSEIFDVKPIWVNDVKREVSYLVHKDSNGDVHFSHGVSFILFTAHLDSEYNSDLVTYSHKPLYSPGHDLITYSHLRKQANSLIGGKHTKYVPNDVFLMWTDSGYIAPEHRSEYISELLKVD